MKIQRRMRRNGWTAALFVLFAVCVCACGKRSSGSGIVQRRMGTGETAKKEEQPQKETENAAGDGAAAELYIVEKLNEEQKLADVRKAEGGRQLQYTYDVGTRFLDKYGTAKSVSSFLPGDVVELSVKESEQKLVQMQLSDEVWVYDDIVNYAVDESINAFVIGQTKYAYDPAMDIYSGDEKVGFSSVGASDVLRAVGTGQKLLSLSIVKGHGYLALANTKLFEGSFICVGERIFEEVQKNMQIEAPEGSYLVTVANNGYGGSKEVVIERNKTTSLNLDELKGEGPQICKITFDVGVEGATLFIDGKKADYSAPVELTYGVHTITVEADGYDPITQKLVVNSKTAEIEIALTETKENKKKNDVSQEANTGSANNSAGNNAGNTNNNAGNNTGNNAGGANNGANGNTNNNTGNNNGTNGSTGQNDYLTTLYNLLTSINNSGGGQTDNHSGNGQTGGDSYDDLRDQ